MARDGFWQDKVAGMDASARQVLLVWAIHGPWPDTFDRCLASGADPEGTLEGHMKDEWLSGQTYRVCHAVNHLSESTWHAFPPLFHALNLGRAGMAEALLAKGVDATFVDADGWGAFYTMAASPACGTLPDALTPALTRLVRRLAGAGADPLRVPPEKDGGGMGHALFHAIDRHGLPEVTALLDCFPHLAMVPRLEPAMDPKDPPLLVYPLEDAIGSLYREDAEKTRTAILALVAGETFAKDPDLVRTLLVDAHHPPVDGIQHLAAVFRARLEKHTLTFLPPAAATPTRPGRL